jgi:hypothetical protein
MKKSKSKLTQLVEAAFQEVAREVIERAERCGTSVIVWEKGRIRRLGPQEARKGLKKKRKKP